MFLRSPLPPVKPYDLGKGRVPTATFFEGKCIAITGVGGFIGFRMVERAIEMGMTVKGLELSAEAVSRAQKKSKLLCAKFRIPESSIQIMQGNVTNSHDAAQLCVGADIVFHTAAIVQEDGSMDTFRKVNVEGTSSAKSLGANTFIHLSSVMVYGFHYHPNITEVGPFRGENNPYCQTKIESEAAALEFQEKGKFDVIIIRPGDVYGINSNPWIDRPLSIIKTGKFGLPNWGNSIFNHVHVDNLIDGVLLAVEQPKISSGEAFVITDDPPSESPTTCAQFFSYHYRWLGIKKMLVLPTFLILFLVTVMGFIDGLLGRPPAGSPAAIHYLNRPHKYSCEKARRLLGYAPRISLEQGMNEIEAHLRQAGLVK